MEELRDLKVLFVEDEKLARVKLVAILNKFFNKVDSAENGRDALEKYNSALFTEPYDLIVSDVNMPVMNGLEMIEELRKKNDEVPIIFTTARNETEYLLKAIELNANYYILKPINLEQLVEKIKVVCEKTLIKKSLEVKKQEMEDLIGTLDSFAAVCKFNKEGNLTYVNEIFCEYSGYSQDELLKINIKDLVCNKSNKISVNAFWESIKSGEQWRGTIKKISKQNSDYYVNNFIMPIKNDLSDEIKEFICIQNLVTEDELKKKHLQNKLYQTLQFFKQKEIENRQELKKLKESFEKKKSDPAFDMAKVKSLVEKIKNLQGQIKHTDDEIKKLRTDKDIIVNKANIKVSKAMESSTVLKKELDYFKGLYKTLEEKNEKTQKKVHELEMRIKEKNKRIEFLMDVIDSKDKKIEELQLKSIKE